MSLVITVIHVAACFFLIAVVLLQTGKGADIGAVFGGSSQTIFGSSGAGNLLTRLTTWTAAVFMVTSIFLTWDSTRHLTVSIADEAPIEPPPLEAPADTGVTTQPEANAPPVEAGGAGDAAAPVAPSAESGAAAPIESKPQAAADNAAEGKTAAAPAAPAAPAPAAPEQVETAPAKAGDAAKAAPKAAPAAKTEGERAPDGAAAGVP